MNASAAARAPRNREVHDMSQQTDKPGMGAAPQHEQADLPALADREGVLEDLERVICEAWESFDAPRTAEPQLDEMLIGRLEMPLPEKAGNPDAILADAARVLDASISPSRPLYLGYIGSA